jgi:hypothetical protein
LELASKKAIDLQAGSLRMSQDPQSEINSLFQEALGTDKKAMHARARLQKLLELDELNWNYFFYLYQSKVKGRAKQGIWIYEEGKVAPEKKVIAYPVVTAPSEMKAHLKSVEYADLCSSPKRYAEAAQGAALWIKKMQAGSGSSLTRTSYLSRILNIPKDQVKIGAKGTDLFIDVRVPSAQKAQKKVIISLAEAQLLRSIRDLERSEFGEVIFHDMVSSETKDALSRLWEKTSLDDPTRTYAEFVEQTPGLSRSGNTFQAFVPTLTEMGTISFNRKAPAGHALFAVDALRAAYREGERPKTEKPLVAAISNGEDLSSAADSTMIGYMVKERVPIALITTERTPVDLKGGVIALLREADGLVSVTVLETAQAKESGQERVFATVPGTVSTNLTLFNYDVLTPLLSKEVQEIGEERFLEIISPDVISNIKEQRDPDGVPRKYTQLEGAMGSTIMNLDRYWRKKYGAPLVHFINVDRMRRTDFFSPIKSAFDYFMQFHSDRFAVDGASFRLKNLRPGVLPQISLWDSETDGKFYQDVENVLESFDGASIRDLDELSVEGKVGLQGIVLRGNVKIILRGRDRVELKTLSLSQTSRAGRWVLENATVEVDSNGRLARKSA